MTRTGLAKVVQMHRDTESRERLDLYLPLNERRVTQFVNDWEGYVTACVQRMRVEDVEDVLYRVFQRAIDGLPRFRKESKISTWLYQITWREAVRQLQKEGRRHQREVVFDWGDREPDPGDSALLLLERQETATEVQQALDRLALPDREVLALRYLDELKLSEIAERLEVPLGTVKARVHRALARLRQALEKRDGI